MQFNQTNNNAGDVNNAISEKGNVVQNTGGHDNSTSTTHNATSEQGNIVQTTGKDNKVEVDHPPKDDFWSTLWGKVKSCWKVITGR
jgi:hypothetical protein